MKQLLMGAALAGALLAAPLEAQEVPVAPTPRAPAPGVNTGMLVSAAWLAERLGDPQVVVLHVARDDAEHRAGHIPGARFVPLSSIVVDRDGVPNELPPVDTLRAVFERAGVSDGSHVVLYGDLGGLSAARAFFTLDVLGHRRVSLLDGGLETWRRNGFATSTESIRAEPGTLTPRPRLDRVVSAEWVRDRLENPQFVLIDARPAAQFSGEDAAGLRPGHIPGAHNIFWRTMQLSEEDPRLRDPDALRAMFAAAGTAPGRTVVAYCRSGVQASFAYFVARYLGYDVVMYDGSFIDWSRRADLPVAR